MAKEEKEFKDAVIDRQKEKTGFSKEKSSREGQKDLTPCIVDIDEAPSFLIDNKFLLTGYRKNYRSFGVIFKSMFQAHNEVMNIWTHLLGLLFLLSLAIMLFDNTLADHSLVNHLKEVKALQKLDSDSLNTLTKETMNCHNLYEEFVHPGESENQDSDSQHNISHHKSMKSMCKFVSAVQEGSYDEDFFESHSYLKKIKSSLKVDHWPHDPFHIKDKVFHAVSFLQAASFRFIKREPRVLAGSLKLIQPISLSVLQYNLSFVRVQAACDIQDLEKARHVSHFS